MFGTRTKSDVVSADEKLFSAIRSSYKDEIGNVEITFDFTAKLGENPVLAFLTEFTPSRRLRIPYRKSNQQTD